VATWGSGKPVIALGSDIDDIPQASQKPGIAWHEARVEGAVRIGDFNVYNGTSATQLRRRVGMVFQKPNPFPTMSIYDNVAAGLKLNGFRNRKKLDQLYLGDAILIGLSQALAIIPGVSRSGATITTARLLGVELGHGGDRQRAGNLACRVTAHAVRHREQARPRIRRVLVPFTEEADVRTYRVAEY